jgi:hypothetical protein
MSKCRSIWATQQLKEYIIKGFALDDQRLKNASAHPPLRRKGIRPVGGHYPTIRERSS